MANTITKSGHFLTLSAIDSDWLWSTQWPEFAAIGIPLYSIQFEPAAATDKCVIMQEKVTGPIIFSKDLDADGSWETGMLIKYYGGQLVKPVLDVSAGSYNAGALVMIQLAVSTG